MTCCADPRQARRQQQQQPDRGDRVAVALEHVVVAQELDRQREEDQAEDEPVGLVAGQAFVDPVDHHQAERGQQRDQREQVGVGVGQADPQVDVGGEADGEEVGAVDQAEVAELRVLLGEDRGEAGGEQEGDGNEGDQLPVPGRSSLRRLPWLCFDFFDQGDGVGARAQVVAGDRVAAPRRQRVGLDRARVALVVELDPEGQLVGQAAVEGDPAAVRRCRGTRPAGCPYQAPKAIAPRTTSTAQHLGGGPQPPPLRLRGELLAALAGGLGGGAAADLGRGQARPPRRAGRSGSRPRARAGGAAASSSRKASAVMLSRPPARLASSTSARTAASIESAPARTRAICSSSIIVVSPSEQSRKTSPGRGRDGLHVDLDLRLGAQRPGDDRALRVVLGLGVGELALAPHLLDQRVVAGEALELAAAQPVGAAVADVADRDLLVGGVDDRGGDRRPHPGQRGVVVGEVVDLAVRGLDRLPQEPLRAARRAGRGRRRRPRPCEATSPAWAPPIPSATTKIGARTKNESSLALRWRPVSVRNAWSSTRSTAHPRLEPELGVADPDDVAVDQLRLAGEARRR